MRGISKIGKFLYGEDLEPHWFVSSFRCGIDDDSSEDDVIPALASPDCLLHGVVVSTKTDLMQHYH